MQSLSTVQLQSHIRTTTRTHSLAHHSAQSSVHILFPVFPFSHSLSSSPVFSSFLSLACPLAAALLATVQHSALHSSPPHCILLTLPAASAHGAACCCSGFLFLRITASRPVLFPFLSSASPLHSHLSCSFLFCLVSFRILFAIAFSSSLLSASLIPFRSPCESAAVRCSFFSSLTVSYSLFPRYFSACCSMLLRRVSVSSPQSSPISSPSSPLCIPPSAFYFSPSLPLFASLFVSLSASDSHCLARDAACSLDGSCLLSTCSVSVSILSAPFRSLSRPLDFSALFLRRPCNFCTLRRAHNF